jgi:hypothetical protein
MRLAWLVLVSSIAGAAAFAELGDKLAPNVNHPAIAYETRPPRDAVSELNRQLEQGGARLQFEPGSGYLRSVLDQLRVPVESQMAVFSKTSLQAPLIEPKNPRAIYFNDSVAVAWMRGGFIELASQDPEQGVIFHILEQRPSEAPRFRRRYDCTRCHIADASLGVPGMLVHSWYPALDGMPKLILGRFATDHRSPFEERWGGWYVTGTHGGMHHRGNAVARDREHPDLLETRGTQNITSVAAKIDPGVYLSKASDIVALMTFEHQTRMTNLMIRAGWDARVGENTRLEADVEALVTYMLFADEAKLYDPVEGVSTFTKTFAERGPRDHQGRSLRDFDLKTRMFRYPLSYMIYSEAFDAMPGVVRDRVYQRLYDVLSGKDATPKFARLSSDDRSAILAIVRDTKPGLPDYWR